MLDHSIFSHHTIEDFFAILKNELIIILNVKGDYGCF